MSQSLNVNFTQYFARELASLVDLEEDGLVEKRANHLSVTDLGRFFIRNTAMRFDAYLDADKERRFSKTI